MVCVSALLALAAAPPSRSPSPSRSPFPAKNLPVVPGSQYLALGDSVTFGYMESTVVPAPNYANAASFPGYPEQLGSRLRLSVANAACPGETAASLVNASAPSNGCENSPSHNPADNYRNNPLHVNYKGSQLAFALSYLHSHHNVRLITLMIGANDFFLCQETTADSCASTAKQNATVASVTKNIHTILSGDPQQVPLHRPTGDRQLLLAQLLRPRGQRPVTAPQQVQDAAAKPFGVKIADGYGELEAATAHSGDNTCTAGLLTS